MSKIEFGALQNWNHFLGIKNVTFHLSVAAEFGYALQQLREESEAKSNDFVSLDFGGLIRLMQNVLVWSLNYCDLVVAV